MRLEEELLELRQENNDLHELLAQRDELIAHLQQRVQMLEERLAKDSHNSHLPPSSDRFVRQPKSLRKKSGKQVGGQQGHKGTTLMWSESPDEVIVQAVTCCEHCQHDLKVVKPLQIERRQVVDVPAPRLLVQEYRAERKLCPFCQQVTVCSCKSIERSANSVLFANRSPPLPSQQEWMRQSSTGCVLEP